MLFLINMTVELNINSALKFCSGTEYGSIFKLYKNFKWKIILFQFYYTLTYKKPHFMRHLKELKPLLQLYFKLQI